MRFLRVRRWVWLAEEQGIGSHWEDAEIKECGVSKQGLRILSTNGVQYEGEGGRFLSPLSERRATSWGHRRYESRPNQWRLSIRTFYWSVLSSDRKIDYTTRPPQLLANTEEMIYIIGRQRCGIHERMTHSEASIGRHDFCLTTLISSQRLAADISYSGLRPKWWGQSICAKEFET